MWYHWVQLSNKKKAWEVGLGPKEEIDNEITFVLAIKSSCMHVANFSTSISSTVFLQPPGSLSENNLISFPFGESCFYCKFF